MPSAIEAFAGAIQNARTTLSSLRVVGPRYFLLTALAGYLWAAIGTAQTLLAAVKSGSAGGAGSLKRLLHESYLDAVFMINDSDPDSLAVRSFLSVYRDSLALLREYRQVLKDHPGISLPPVPPSWTFFDRPTNDVIKELDQQNAAHGGSGDLFKRAWAWWEKANYWHWSGVSRKKMVDRLISRGKMDGRAAFIAMSLTRIFNSEAHASPPWEELAPADDGSIAAPPSRSSEIELTQLALSGAQLLEGLSTEVKQFFIANAA